MPNNIKNYSNYELFDFLLDSDFKQWVLEPNQEIDAYWKQVLEVYPYQKDVIDKAIKLIKHLPEKEKRSQMHRAQVLWDKIDEEIAEENSPSTHKPIKLKLYFLKYAAVLVAVLAIAVIIYTFQKNTQINIVTGNGENKEITLPDGSILQLAPNSSVSYFKNISKQSQREVWAKGEVSFNVKHLNQNPNFVKKGERFVVHLSQSIDVMVLGTVFNISERRGKAVVHLESGAVKITKVNQQLLLKPGESAISNSKLGALTLEQSAQKLTHEWESHILSLNKTKISTILEVMNDNYGVSLKLENELLLKKEIDGALPLDDLDKALKILLSITDGKVVKKDGFILITK